MEIRRQSGADILLRMSQAVFCNLERKDRTKTEQYHNEVKITLFIDDACDIFVS